MASGRHAVVRLRRGLLAALALSALGGAVAAHPSDELRGLLVGVMSVERVDEADGRVDVTVGVLIMNQRGEAATLRGASAAVAERVRIFETVTVLGFETERDVSFFKLDPGEARMLQPPNGRITVEGVDPARLENGAFTLTLDFGPAGQHGTVIRLEPDRPEAAE